MIAKVLIMGPSGAGKSRVAEELRKEIKGVPVTHMDDAIDLERALRADDVRGGFCHTHPVAKSGVRFLEGGGHEHVRERDTVWPATIKDSEVARTFHQSFYERFAVAGQTSGGVLVAEFASTGKNMLPEDSLSAGVDLTAATVADGLKDGFYSSRGLEGAVCVSVERSLGSRLGNVSSDRTSDVTLLFGGDDIEPLKKAVMEAGAAKVIPFNNEHNVSPEELQARVAALAREIRMGI